MTKKKLPVRFTGQHFTIDKVLIKDAIRQANISNQDTVLDIGAGKGFLTVHLLKIANNVVAIENDTALVEHLRKLFSDARNVQVVGCDFRNFAVPKFPFKVVSNIPYGITSDIFKILMFESLGNFLGGSIILQLEPTQKLFSRKLYNPYTVFYHTFFDLKLVYEVGPESFLPPPTVKSALLNIKRKHLFFDFKFKAKYLAFISCLLEKPDLSVKTALKSIFRKSQVRSISEKFGLNLNAQIVCLSPSQWVNCFLEMLEVVPDDLLIVVRCYCCFPIGIYQFVGSICTVSQFVRSREIVFLKFVPYCNPKFQMGFFHTRFVGKLDCVAGLTACL
jgi:23S rRNA (adenine-N6)-dimethyltransferase